MAQESAKKKAEKSGEGEGVMHGLVMKAPGESGVGQRVMHQLVQGRDSGNVWIGDEG